MISVSSVNTWIALRYVPWIAFMDESITTSAEKGYYVVYLFAPDGKSILFGKTSIRLRT